MVSSGLVALIPPYSNNALKRVAKAPRIYFILTKTIGIFPPGLYDV